MESIFLFGIFNVLFRFRFSSALFSSALCLEGYRKLDKLEYPPIINYLTVNWIFTGSYIMFKKRLVILKLLLTQFFKLDSLNIVCLISTWILLLVKIPYPLFSFFYGITRIHQLTNHKMYFKKLNVTYKLQCKHENCKLHVTKD